MKSSHSVRKSATPQRSSVRKDLKLKAPRRVAVAQKSGPAIDPFSSLIPPVAKLVPPVVQAIEAQLELRGLDPARCRSVSGSGVEYRFSIDGGITVTAEIACTREILSEPFLVIRAKVGVLTPRLRNASVLESLLFLNLARNQRCRTGLRSDGAVQVLFSARVCEQFDLFEIPALLRETLDFATFVRGTFVGEDAFLSSRSDESPSSRAPLH